MINSLIKKQIHSKLLRSYNILNIILCLIYDAKTKSNEWSQIHTKSFLYIHGWETTD